MTGDPNSNRRPPAEHGERLDPSDAAPDFSEIVSAAQKRSAERLEQLRKRAEAIAHEQQRRWDEGTVMLNGHVRPLLERALQACVEEGIPANLEDNFSEKATTPRLLFYCSEAVSKKIEGRPVVKESIKMVVEGDGKCIRAGTAKSFSTYAEGMKVCENPDDELTTIFSAVLESYFQSCERDAAFEMGTEKS